MPLVTIDNLVPTPFIPSGEPAPLPPFVWLPDALFVVNWSTGVSVSTRWQTDVVKSASQLENRYGLWTKPARQVAVRFHAFNSEQTQLMDAWMQRLGMSNLLFPIFSDHATLTSDVTIGDTELLMDPSYRRFFGEQRVLVFRPGNAPLSPQFEVLTVDQVQADRLTLVHPATMNWVAGDRVYPLIESNVMLRSSAAIVTDDKLELNLRMREKIGRQGVPPLDTPGATLVDFDYHAGLPIYDFVPDFKRPELGFERPGTVSEQGRGEVTDIIGCRPAATRKLQHLFCSRQASWRFLKFFDNRGGRLHPFWLPSQVSQFRPVARPEDDELHVEAGGDISDWDLRPFVSVLEYNGNVTIYEVDEVNRVGDVDQVTFKAGSPALPTLSVMRRVGVALRCRFRSDELVENWNTGGHLLCEVEVIELPKEAENTVALLDTICEGDDSLVRWKVEGDPDDPSTVLDVSPPVAECELIYHGELYYGVYQGSYYNCEYIPGCGAIGCLPFAVPLPAQFLDCSATDIYFQARSCATGEPVNLWVAVSDIMRLLPVFILTDGTAYYFDFDDFVTTRPPGRWVIDATNVLGTAVSCAAYADDPDALCRDNYSESPITPPTYNCPADIAVSGAGVVGANGTYTKLTLDTWRHQGDADWRIVKTDNLTWEIQWQGQVRYLGPVAGDQDCPTGVPAWSSAVPLDDPPPTVAGVS